MKIKDLKELALNAPADPRAWDNLRWDLLELGGDMEIPEPLLEDARLPDGLCELRRLLDCNLDGERSVKLEVLCLRREQEGPWIPTFALGRAGRGGQDETLVIPLVDEAHVQFTALLSAHQPQARPQAVDPESEVDLRLYGRDRQWELTPEAGVIHRLEGALHSITYTNERWTARQLAQALKLIQELGALPCGPKLREALPQATAILDAALTAPCADTPTTDQTLKAALELADRVPDALMALHADDQRSQRSPRTQSKEVPA